MNRISKPLFITFILVPVVVLLLAGCGPSAGESQSSGTGNRVAFVYTEAIADYNWSHLHELGRQYLAEQLPDIETAYRESVAPDQAETVLRELAEEGYKLIFATAPEYSDAVLSVAADFPDTYFEVAKGSETAENVATYDGRMYQIFYVAGGYTGEMTVTGKIGFIAPEPTVEVIQHINAITMATLTVRSFEDITVNVKWTGAWVDPEADRQAALELIEDGADVLVQHTYTPEVQKVAEESGVRAIGYGFDMREFAPTANMTSIVWNWGWYYVQRVNSLTDGAWESQAYFGETSDENFGEGIIDLAPYTYDQIPQIMEAVPMKWRARFVETNRDVFEGPISAQNGDLVLANRETFDDAYLFTEMNWFVQGVVGEAPGEAPPSVE